jgi:hypothetical protein
MGPRIQIMDSWRDHRRKSRFSRAAHKRSKCFHCNDFKPSLPLPALTAMFGYFRADIGRVAAS